MPVQKTYKQRRFWLESTVVAYSRPCLCLAYRRIRSSERKVTVNFLFDSVRLPLILLILGCTLLGGIIVGAFGIYRGYRLQKQVNILKAKLVHIEEVTGYDLAAAGTINSEAKALTGQEELQPPQT